jgi:hypothetical protein
VKRRSVRLTIVLVGALSCALVGGTSFAAHRATMTAKQCCKSHCRHKMPTERAAKQCCRAHPAVPAAQDTVKAPPLFTAALLPPVVVDHARTVTAAPSSLLEHRGPPGRTLVAQHTSLAL